MRWLVVGAGISGVAAARLLKSQGSSVLISENRELPVSDRVKWEQMGIEVGDGGHQSSHLDDVDNILISPGIPNSHPFLKAAKDRGIPVHTEIDLGLKGYSGRLFCVTGTNGKSTICAMAEHLLESLQVDSELVGNFGLPPTEILRTQGALPENLIVELSSYQLEWSKNVSAKLAVFSNFSADHLDHHGTLENYFRAKWRLVETMDPEGFLLTTPEVLKQASELNLAIPGNTWSFVTKKPSENEFALLNNNLYVAGGPALPMAPSAIRFDHNLQNAAFALVGVSLLLSYPVAPLIPQLAGFPGLPHRCEIIGTIGGKTIVNDSKATNVASTITALAGANAPVALLLGGQPKGESYLPILVQKEKIKHIFCFGEAAQEIANELRPHAHTSVHPDLLDAVNCVSKKVQVTPMSILFSPACASFDEFSNFAERGDSFKQHMKPFLD